MSCPSFHLKRIAYFPIGSTAVGLAAGLNMGKVPGASLGASPGWRPDFSRSSLHNAQGHASRRKAKVYFDWCASFHSISTPVPSVTCTFTDLGSKRRAELGVFGVETVTFLSIAQRKRVGGREVAFGS